MPPRTESLSMPKTEQFKVQDVSDSVVVGQGALDLSNLKESKCLEQKEKRTALHQLIPRRSILKTPDTSNDTSEGSKGRGVSFDRVIIRKYSMEIGDNPSCSYGAPVTLGWEYDEEILHDIDIYECERPPRRKTRHLMLNYYRRRDILRKAGYSEEELKAAEREVSKIKRQRSITGFFLPVAGVEAAARTVGRKVKKITGKKATPR